MTISDLKAGQGKVDIQLEITSISEAREFEKFGRKGRVATAQARDASGTIAFTLWNEDIDKVKAGDTIKLTNGFVNEFRGELQLTSGRYGQIEVVGSNPEPSTEVKPEAEEEVIE